MSMNGPRYFLLQPTGIRVICFRHPIAQHTNSMTKTNTHPIALLLGPTGSGKTALALRVAAARPTLIINVDAMQMVADLRVLTARPTEAEESAAEHALYGVLAAQEPTSVARWLALAEPVIRRAWAEGKLPLLVGGTGMYLSALRGGLAAVPEIPETLRADLRARFPSADGGALYNALTARDPAMAALLKPGDTQRLLRALEVIEATGTSLSEWQTRSTVPLFPNAVFHGYYIDMPREESYARIDRRFQLMMENGALDEVRALMAQHLPPETPILRAHGVPELAAYLRGELAMDAAIAKAQQHTRNYAKRQMTWIRNQLPDATPIPADAPADAINP